MLYQDPEPELILSDMAWADVAPAGHTLELEAVRRLAEAILPGQLDESGLRRLELNLHHELLAEFGYWIQGWRWTACDGGPVQASLLDDHADTPVERVVRAVAQWQNFLLEVREAFNGPAATSLAADLEAAALRLLPVVLRHTEASEAWYGTFVVVLGWFLEFRGLDADLYRDEIQALVSGRFHSWCAPEPSQVQKVCALLGAVLKAGKRANPVDGLALWRKERKPGHSSSVCLREPVVARDGHLSFLQAEETRRADRLLQALARAREWAVSGETLQLTHLQDWNRLILAEPAVLRTTPAFAKGGRERYGLPFLDDFRSALKEVSGDPASLCYRAARAYLDVCFFHPFQDGNARTACMLLDAILWREGKALHRVEPVFHLSRSAGQGCLQHLAATINQMLSLRTRS